MINDLIYDMINDTITYGMICFFFSIGMKLSLRKVPVQVSHPSSYEIHGRRVCVGKVRKSLLVGNIPKAVSVDRVNHIFTHYSLFLTLKF